MLNLIPRKGSPSRIRKAAESVATGTGRRMTKRESRYQKPLSVGPRVGVGAALQEGGRAGVDARAEQGEDRGQDGQRDQRREEDDQGAAEPHRVEEALREDEQRGERRGDGEGGEEDGAAGGRQHPAHRRRAGPGAGDLLAVAGDDEEAVVDRQAEAERRGQVEGEDGDRGEFAGDAEDEEGADDRQAADQQRQQRGDEAAEEEQREQEEEREGEHLGPLEVLLDLLVDLFLGDRRAADHDPGMGVQRVGDFAADVLLALVPGRLQGDDEVGRAPVCRRRRRASGCRRSRSSGRLRGCGAPRVRAPRPGSGSPGSPPARLRPGRRLSGPR